MATAVSSFACLPLPKFLGANGDANRLRTAEFPKPVLRIAPLSNASFHRSLSTVKREKRVVCAASNSDAVSQSQKIQKDATKLLAEFLKSEDLRACVQENLDSLTEQFFLVTSTYFEMAKKEKNVEVAKQLENVLKISMEEKEKTLRPEIRLLNQLIREKEGAERKSKLVEYKEYLQPDGYFFQLLNRMLVDVERQKNNPQSKELLTQLQAIKQESTSFISSSL